MWLSVKKAAEHFGVSTNTIRTAIKKYIACGNRDGGVILMSQGSGYRIDPDKFARHFDVSQGWRPKTA